MNFMKTTGKLFSFGAIAALLLSATVMSCKKEDTQNGGSGNASQHLK
jgi:hypothetical protein